MERTDPDPMTIVAPDELELLARIRKGDPVALRELYLLHGGSIYWSAFSMLRSRTDAEEVAADTYLVLWQRRADVIIYGTSMLPWLVVTARNLARNRIRANQRRYADSLDELAELASNEPLPESAAISTEVMDALRSALRRESAVDRAIFQLCLVDDLTYKEAAFRLGLAHGAVRNRLMRLRGRLRTALSAQQERF